MRIQFGHYDTFYLGHFDVARFEKGVLKLCRMRKCLYENLYNILCGTYTIPMQIRHILYHRIGSAFKMMCIRNDSKGIKRSRKLCPVCVAVRDALDKQGHFRRNKNQKEK